MFQPTLDRDVRLSPFQITVIQTALRDEIKKRTRSIDKAEASRAGGGKVFHNVLDEHYAARDAAREIIEILDVARTQIARQVKQRLQDEREERLTKALGIGPGETLRIDIEEEGA
jgi:F0F1-type ATP synthase membrane subunit b/b'